MSQSNLQTGSLTTSQGADAFVSGLTAEAKRAVISSLLRDAIRLTGGNAPIPIDTPEGEVLGYYVPPTWSVNRRNLTPVLSPERIRDIRRSAATPDDTFDPQQRNEELSRADRG